MQCRFCFQEQSIFKSDASGWVLCLSFRQQLLNKRIWQTVKTDVLNEEWVSHLVQEYRLFVEEGRDIAQVSLYVQALTAKFCSGSFHLFGHLMAPLLITDLGCHGV